MLTSRLQGLVSPNHITATAESNLHREEESCTPNHTHTHTHTYTSQLLYTTLHIVDNIIEVINKHCLEYEDNHGKMMGNCWSVHIANLSLILPQ